MPEDRFGVTGRITRRRLKLAGRLNKRNRRLIALTGIPLMAIAGVAVPVVASLVQKAEAIREGEIERLYARCPDLTERERMLITGASLTIISKLLHSVVTRLRQQATSNRVEALTLARTLEELFDLRIRAEELTGHSAPLNE